MFYNVEKETHIDLEHSLISLQKWEAIWHKPFLVNDDKSVEETISYIKCMCLTKNVPEDVFYCIPDKEMIRISKYIDDPMTATTFGQSNTGPTYGKTKKKQIITAEIIYYWMIQANIPSEYKKWHLNQLLTLINVINIKNLEAMPKTKKRSKMAVMRDFKSINEQNKKLYNTSG